MFNLYTSIIINSDSYCFFCGLGVLDTFFYADQCNKIDNFCEGGLCTCFPDLELWGKENDLLFTLLISALLDCDESPLPLCQMSLSLSQTLSLI